MSVYDGDTVTCCFELDNKPQLFKCRMIGYDSAEIRIKKADIKILN
jgi:hypothetical protein